MKKISAVLLVIVALLFAAAPSYAESIIENTLNGESASGEEIAGVLAAVVLFAAIDATAAPDNVSVGFQPPALKTFEFYDEITGAEEVVQIVNVIRYSF